MHKFERLRNLREDCDMTKHRSGNIYTFLNAPMHTMKLAQEKFP